MNKTCNCRVCLHNVDDNRIRDIQLIKKYGFIVHYLDNDVACPNSINYHTHGLVETFGHPDIQLCFPLSPRKAMELFDIVINKIKDGAEFEIGLSYPDLFKRGEIITFIEAKEYDRKVLRIILKDAGKNYPEQVYAAQLTAMEYIPHCVQNDSLLQ